MDRKKRLIIIGFVAIIVFMVILQMSRKPKIPSIAERITQNREELQGKQENTDKQENVASNLGNNDNLHGRFDISVMDQNNVKVHSWHDENDNTYYLFLTNAVAIDELEILIDGVRINQSSAGTVDQNRNSVKGAFSKDLDRITIKTESGNSYDVVVKQSGLPSLCISLKDTTLDTITSGSKNTKYPGQTVVLTDAAGNIDLSISDVELKGRGNSTWDSSEKKPFQLTLPEKKNVLGMKEAAKWVLLANSFDDSMMRNKVASYLGDGLEMAYTPDLEYVDLWMDGNYCGTYTLGEKCEIDPNRLNLTDSLGVLAELDNVHYKTEEHWFKDEAGSAVFTLSGTVDAEKEEAAFDNFKSKVEMLEEYLQQTTPDRITLEDLGKFVNVEDISKWYLVNEYLSNTESFSTSWYWYSDGKEDVLHMGPVWDFDAAMGNSMENSSPGAQYGRMQGLFFRDLFRCSEYSDYVLKLYDKYSDVFASLDDQVIQWKKELSAAAECNYTRWQWLGTRNRKGNDYAQTYDMAVRNLQRWLVEREQRF